MSTAEDALATSSASSPPIVVRDDGVLLRGAALPLMYRASPAPSRCIAVCATDIRGPVPRTRRYPVAAPLARWRRTSGGSGGKSHAGHYASGRGEGVEAHGIGVVMKCPSALGNPRRALPARRRFTERAGDLPGLVSHLPWRA